MRAKIREVIIESSFTQDMDEMLVDAAVYCLENNVQVMACHSTSDGVRLTRDILLGLIHGEIRRQHQAKIVQA